MEVTQSLRYRINISRGMKGGCSFEATVDAEGYDMSAVLDASDKLVKKLEERYPAPMEVK
jgi:hypothetical protein